MRQVLVIDDDRSIGIAIKTLLRRRNYFAVLADSSQLGVEAFEAFHFDVVMVDIFMPGRDGLETIKGFQERAPTVPIVAMSGYRFRNSTSPTPDFLGMAAGFGATYCLRKPFGPQQLMAAIHACVPQKLPERGGTFPWQGTNAVIERAGTEKRLPDERVSTP
jgi:DNA-binding response OmpR family regulator